MKIVGLDIGSTTVKAVVTENGAVIWRDYQRHYTRQAEMVLAFLTRMEDECGVKAGADRLFVTGSGAGLLAPRIGGKTVQEVVAIAAAVEKYYPQVNFVSEIGGEDMKTLFFAPAGEGKSKQMYMQSACSGGTGTFIEKIARRLNIPIEQLSQMDYLGYELHKISSKCGIFAETDANTLVKSGVRVEEIIASLFESVVYQNLATLTRGNTPMPNVLLLGGPNLFYKGLQQAWRYHLKHIWDERKCALPEGAALESLIHVPEDAQYYACLGCVEVGAGEEPLVGVFSGREQLQWWIEQGQCELKAREGKKGLVRDAADFASFMGRYAQNNDRVHTDPSPAARGKPVAVGCDFGSTTVKAVVLSGTNEVLASFYVPSIGNPIEDAKVLFRKIHEGGYGNIGGLAITGYGKDLLNDVIGADVSVVETVAHAAAALHYFPDADVICDVGGVDVKIMVLHQGTVSDFRLNSQCSSGNGAFLQGIAERYGVPLEQYAERAFRARSIPALAMGCGVFLQSDIVNQQRKGWSPEEIMAGLAAVLPLNVWVYAGQLQNLAAAGRKFVLQGGTHRNLAVVKAQIDFISGKVPDAKIVVHPYPGEAGAIGAALCAADWMKKGKQSRFRGVDTIEALDYISSTNDLTTCNWCAVSCRRTFIDVRLADGKGRNWSKVPLEAGWERVISGNTCPKGLLEDVNEMRAVTAELEEVKRVYPNIAELVREGAFQLAKT